jgi:peptidoglycan/xylan/chitin deacetylase (PgdA/CDA1 family)
VRHVEALDGAGRFAEPAGLRSVVMPATRLALFGSSLLGVVLLCFGPRGSLGVALALLGLLLHAALATLGVLLPGLRVFSDPLCRGASGRALVALTFDDGPDPVTTRAVLELLQRRGAKATFFVLGEKVVSASDVISEILAGGHELGLHGYAHDRLYALRSRSRVAADIRRVREVVERVAGRPVAWFRPPVGFVSPEIAAAVRREGVTLVGWSVRALDGRASATPPGVLARVTARLRDGAIVLLHDASERGDREPASLSVLGALLDELERRGLRAVTLSELHSAATLPG